MMRKVLSEFFGTAFLLMIVTGSGIMGTKLANGNEAIVLLVNSLATGFGLFVLIQNLGSISGAHFNPIVSLTEYFWRRLSLNELIFYLLTQFTGAIVGILLTHYMFDLPIIQISAKIRSGSHLFVSEIIATIGLLATIRLAGKKHVEWAPLTIASYITSAYWFTSSTSFANPAVTLARAFTNTFCGISTQNVFNFILAQVIALFFVIFAEKILIINLKKI